MTANVNVKHLCMPCMHMGGGVRGLQIGALLIPNLRDLCSSPCHCMVEIGQMNTLAPLHPGKAPGP